MVTVSTAAGNVYVGDAMPLPLVVATGVPNAPPAPASLNATLTPVPGLPLHDAKTVRPLGRRVLTLPLWLLPQVALGAQAASVSVNLADVYPELVAVMLTV